MAGTFSQRGGARIGLINASWPFAVVSADEASLQLSCFGFGPSFPKEEIKALSLHKALFSKGLRIEHPRQGVPKFLVFWSFNFAKLSEGLANLGYEIRSGPLIPPPLSSFSPRQG